MGLVDAASSGSRLSALEELRDVLARAVNITESGRDLAALSRQLADVLKQIDEVRVASPAKKGTALDELNARRAARGAKAASR